MELVEIYDYDVDDIGDALWSGGKDWWEDYNDEERQYIFDYFESYAYDSEDTPTLTAFNDFVWYDSYDILKEAGLRFDDVVTDNYTVTMSDDGMGELKFTKTVIDDVTRCRELFANSDLVDTYDSFEEAFNDMVSVYNDVDITYDTYSHPITFDPKEVSADFVEDLADDFIDNLTQFVVEVE